jgi:hypothetical protein
LRREGQEDHLADFLSRQAVFAVPEDQAIPVDLQRSLRQCFFAVSLRGIVVFPAWHLLCQVKGSEVKRVMIVVFLALAKGQFA